MKGAKKTEKPINKKAGRTCGRLAVPAELCRLVLAVSELNHAKREYEKALSEFTDYALKNIP